MFKQLLAGAVFALIASEAGAQSGNAQLTDCTKGCTVIACDDKICAVHVYDDTGWNVASTYDAPVSRAEVRKTRYEERAPELQAESASTDLVLAPTDANGQLAKVCKSDDSNHCSIYSVSTEGVTQVGEI